MIKLLLLILFISTSLFSNELFTPKELEYIQKHKPIKIGSIDSYVPFSFTSGDKKIGFTQDLLKLISNKSGLTFEKVGGTWPEVYGKFKNGEIEMISELSFREHRLEFTNYTKPYYEIPIGIFGKKEFGEYKGVDSLKGKRIGLVKNSFLLSTLKQIDGLNIIEIDSNKKKFFYLKDDKVDIILSNILSMHKIEKLMLKDIKLLGTFNYKDLKAEDLRFGIKKDELILSSIINKTLDSIPFATISKLKQKWILEYEQSLNRSQGKIDLTEQEKKYLFEKDSITMCIDPDWAPFEKFSNNNEYIGITADYFKIFEKSISTKFDVVHTKTWSESIEQAKQRKCDILSAVMETPSRKEYLNFTTPYIKVPLVVATKINFPFVNDIENLQGKKVGLPKGYAFVELLKNKYPMLNIIEVKNMNDGLQNLNKGNIDAYIGTLATVGYKLQQEYLGELKISGKINYTLDLGIGIRNDDQILFDIFQKAVDNLSALQHREILNQWVSIKYEKGTDFKLIWQIVVVFLIIVVLISYFLIKQISLRKKLHIQKEEFESIFKYSKDGIAILNLKADFLKFNTAYIEMTGYTQNELLEKNCLELTAPEYKEATLEVFKKLLEKGYVDNFEKECIMNHNKRIHANITVTLLPDKKRVLLVMKNITNLKILEEQEKLASMGEMIGNIAHQWRQPLSIISTLASGTKFRLEIDESITNEDIINASDKIVEQTQYLSTTIDDFKNFIKGDAQYKNIKIQDVLNTTLNLVNPTLSSNYIQLIDNFNGDLTILGSASELEQALINIINNAKDILCENQSEQNRYLFIQTTNPSKDSLLLKIYDNGGGISEENIERVFEPYFTTKHQNVGTGLGLSMANTIITQRHKQTLTVHNEEFIHEGSSYKGACFEIVFKAVD